MGAQNDKALRHPDPLALQRRCDRAAGGFGEAAFIHARAREELLARLDLLAISPSLVLDLGAGTGLGADALAKRYPRAGLVEVDRSAAMLRERKRRRWLPATRRGRRWRLRADAGALPLADDSAGLVFSNLLLPVCEDPDRVLAEVRRVLRPGAPFVFTSLGPDTLRELRTAWAGVDDDAHVADFVDMHDLGDALTRTGFAEPVLDVDKIVVTYASQARLWRDLTASAARNTLPGRRPTLTGKARFEAMRSALADAAGPQGLAMTVELVYAQCWGTKPAAARDPGLVHIDPGSIGRLQRNQ
jgi:malonyl-CoA O-methyltransferase